ncbi:hypothetical protein [Pseudogemmobacter blasticus]|uniref:Uncharacterized protein n=1 Tax=Fuscovulum blasticum DSM 2131 TaxID=1188250 RepID=A0A2T4JE71_FUSBL|nr:hypothetical protein [Fuscovulum blasticum]PTE16143.1 hypothetical protein C5F44_03770 [Fuscovulum blasticum DSM 2131]
MVLRTLLAERFRGTLDRGRSALVWSVLLAALLSAGSALLLTAAVMGLSRLIGPSLAMTAVGLGLIVAAAALALWRRRVRPAGPFLPARPAVTAGYALGQAGFVLGFLMARNLLRRRLP